MRKVMVCVICLSGGGLWTAGAYGVQLGADYRAHPPAICALLESSD